MKPASMNAFDLISLSSGLDLSGLFEQPQVWQNMPPILNFCTVQVHMLIRSVHAYFFFCSCNQPKFCRPYVVTFTTFKFQQPEV